MGRYKVRYQHDETDAKEKEKVVDHIMSHNEIDANEYLAEKEKEKFT